MNIKRLTVGKLVNTHGIRGEVKVMPMTDFADQRFQKGRSLILSHPSLSDDHELVIDRVRRQHAFFIIHFQGFDAINDVQGWKGGLLHVSVEDQIPLAEGEYYFHEIIGSDVYDEANNRLGVVKEVLTPGANDVWVVERPRQTDLLVPVIDDCIRQVDVGQKRIVIHLMQGLD